jgi:hypothetical protein
MPCGARLFSSFDLVLSQEIGSRVWLDSNNLPNIRGLKLGRQGISIKLLGALYELLNLFLSQG